MGYSNISIKLLEEEFPQEDSKVKVTLQGLLARYKYIAYWKELSANPILFIVAGV
jgi:hypothetical protein